MMVPSLMSAILKRVDFSVTIIAWLIGVILTAVSVYIGNSYNSLSFFGFSSFYLLFISREHNRYRLEIETRSKHEIELFRAKAACKESENSATELRHMIGNVAHDLKTVSSSSFIFFKTFIKL